MRLRVLLPLLAAMLLLPTGAAATTVKVLGGFFDPAELEIAPGTEVTWTNEDSMPHTVTSTWDEGATFDVILRGGESFTHTFADAGTWPVHCRPHSGMEMTVVAEVAEAGSIEKGVPGLPVVGLLIALCAALLLSRRR